MFGRSKPATNDPAVGRGPAARRSRARVGASAVAVSARRGTSGKRSCRTRELEVVGPEVVAPLRDAMRLVDREQGDPCTRPAGRGSRRQQPLRRHVEQVELALAHRALDARPAARKSSDELSAAARTPSWRQRRDLVLHQRDQRRDDDGRARPGTAPAPGSRATCRRRSASGPARRRRRGRGRSTSSCSPRKAG